MSARHKTTIRKQAAKTRRVKRSQPEQSQLSDETPNGRQWGLQLLVFVSGAVLMGLEIAGSRILAPHFGNSIFVWGSLISVFLTALSVGYFVGGRIADRYPSRLLLHFICACAALSIFAIAFVSDGVSSWLVELGLGEQSGPLVASLVLFLLPSVGLGIVSPFAIRLATISLHSVGRSAGTLYALSTLGSIAGTLVTTFLLIPQFGVTSILKAAALLMLVTAGVTVRFWQRPGNLSGAGVLALVGAVCFALPVRGLPLRPGEDLLVDEDTPYHHISVVENGPVRELRFDQYVESAILTTAPYPSVATYTDYFHLAFLVEPDIDHALFIGAGGGIGPRTFSRHAPDMAIDVVDVDPKVLEIAREYFFFEVSRKVRSIAQDGRMFLSKSRAQYDCIVLDAFTIGGRIPFHLVTREFFDVCAARMTDNGVFMMNINSSIQGPASRIFASTVKTLNQVFRHTYVFAKDHQRYGVEQSMNVILVATNYPERLSLGNWETRVDQYWSPSYVDRVRLKRAVEDLLVDLPDVSRAPTFTDNYAPIELMSF